MNNLAAIILAAGKGVRMASDLPKVLHRAGGQSLLSLVATAAAPLAGAGTCLVIGNGAEQVQQEMGPEYIYALQEQQLGTGHAVMQALAALNPLPEQLLVLCGDTPLLRSATLAQLVEQHLAGNNDCTILTAQLADPLSYGRIIRDGNGRVRAIVEAKDATTAQLEIGEINSGVYCFNGAALRRAIAGLSNDNAQGEYYLTDVISRLVGEGGAVGAVRCADSEEIAGVNDRIQLAQAEQALRWRKVRELMLAGVTFIDPSSAYIDQQVEIGRDTVMQPQVYLHGKTKIGRNCAVGPAVKVVDSIVGDNCDVGPFCYLRPGTVLENKVKAGHFVEIKKSHIGSGSKVPHLTYIGDSEIGERVNIGCGTITCNYDGKHKHKTIIGDDVFVGSNTNFVAPVQIHNRATIAAGSTITKDVPEDALGVARGRQHNIEGWGLRSAERDEK